MDLPYNIFTSQQGVIVSTKAAAFKIPPTTYENNAMSAEQKTLGVLEKRSFWLKNPLQSTNKG